MSMFAFARAINGGQVNQFETPRKSACADLLAQGWTPIEASDFVDSFLSGSTHDGRPLWRTAHAAAVAIGFDGCEYDYRGFRQYWSPDGTPDHPDRVDIDQYVCYRETDRGTSYGGAGGSVRAWMDFRTGEILGYL